MGDFFEPDVKTVDPRVLSLLSGKQGRLQSRLAERLYESLGGEGAFEPSPEDIKKYWKGSVLQPSLRSFEQDISPMIEAGFSRHGGLSSRKSTVLARALGDVYSNATAQLAQMQLADLMSARQQQLGALGIGLQPTRTGVQPQAYSTPGLGSQLFGLGGTLLGAGLFGVPGIPKPGEGGTGIFGGK